MRAILLLGVSTLLGVLPLACAETEGADPSRATDDAGVDALEGTDGGDGGDADPTETDGGCSDCAWFPGSCSKGALCTVSVDALDPRTVLFAFDVHGDEVTAVGSYGSVVDYTSGSWRRSGVGSPDTLRGIARLGGDVWAASSVEGVFIREASGGATGWTEHQAGGPTYFFWNNLPVTALFSEPAGTWVWATTATSCAPLYSSEGVGLVRLRRQPDWLELETIIQNRPPMSTCLTMNALDGAGGTLWVAGDKGVLYKVTDPEASPPVVTLERSETSRSLLGVWAEPTGHVFVVGKDGTVQHRPPGGVFAPLGEGVPPVAYHAVRGTSASDVWIAGEDATVMHYDGQRWTRVPIAGLGDRRPTLRAIAAIAPDRVWVAGDNVLLGLAREDGSRP
ncbi:MAG: hypothetical protein BGO98_49590 [Myxococcales bacterium 68-20]|nr:MAG: hypothetical protein BGO98_49590 [Myxococcales bacterium 68-20]